LDVYPFLQLLIYFLLSLSLAWTSLTCMNTLPLAFSSGCLMLRICFLGLFYLGLDQSSGDVTRNWHHCLLPGICVLHVNSIPAFLDSFPPAAIL
jgi:hypothetical protein